MKVGNIGRLDPYFKEQGITGLIHCAKMEEEVWNEFYGNSEYLAYFRSAVMSAYNFQCCISGVGNPALLEACHIVDWVKDNKNRINPKNGLCMNPFFHKAYDKHLLTITPDYTILISEELLQHTSETLFKTYLKEINGIKIFLPDKFLPQRELLEIHYNNYKMI